MGGDKSWFSSLWKTSRNIIATEPEKATIGILAFEVSALMTKFVNLWQCLSDFQILKLREDIKNSFGLRKLVSDDEKYLYDLALAEMIENLVLLAKPVAILGKRCTNPAYHRLEHVSDDPFATDPNWYGWEYKTNKMEKKVKKMERFVAVTTQLHQELEVLAEVEQNLRRMKANTDLSQVKLLEFQKKVIWQRQEVKNLRGMSPWIRTYDYIVRLFIRSLFTIRCRIKHVFETSQSENVGELQNWKNVDDNMFARSYSSSARMLTSVHPSENELLGFKSMVKANKNKWKKYDFNRTRQFSHGSFGGCIPGGTESPFKQNYMQIRKGSLRSAVTFSSDRYIVKDTNMVPLFNANRKLLKASSSTLGGTCLSLHYANLIVLIEKLALAPHLISLDARDDLYNLLPTSMRSTLRVKLKSFARTPASSIYDPTLAEEWGSALTRIVEWLAPLAHNMIRWHSMRNFEKNHLLSEPNILLVQTLHFADQEKTEAAIVELLMGLNYLSRFGGEIHMKTLS